MTDQHEPDVIEFRKQEQIEATRPTERARLREAHPDWSEDRIKEAVDRTLRNAGLAVYPSPAYFACIRGQKKVEQAGRRQVNNLAFMKGVSQ